MHQGSRQRKISPFEWLYLSISRGFPPCAIQLRLTATTLPTRAAMEAALAKAAAANVGARLVPHKGWWIDSGQAPRVRLLPATERASLSHPVFHEPFHFETSPAIEILLWEDAGIFFRCSHALMDAGGLLFFAEETFRALRQEPLLGTTLTGSTRQYLDKFAHPKRRAWYRPNRISPIDTPDSEVSGFVWETRTIPGSISAIAARIASSLSHLTTSQQSGAASRIFMPVDLRHLDSTLRSTCNLSNAFFLEAPDAASWNAFYGWTLDAFARHDEHVTSDVDKLIRMIPLPLLSAFHQWTHARQVRNNQYFFSAILSHIGNISLQAFSADDFIPTSATLLPFDAPGTALTMVTAQHENGIEISASCPIATGSNGRLGKILDRICADLEHGRYTAPSSVLPATKVSYIPEDGPHMDLPPTATIYTLFAEQLSNTPEHIAMSDATRRFTYAELDYLIQNYAAQLQAHGVTPGANVAIVSGRSIEMLISLLAILKIGAAFIPIDIEWPIERSRFVLNDCQPACIVVDEEHTLSTDFPGIRFSELASPARNPHKTVAHAAQNSHAYILYTSGSTGRPKGVVVEHRSLLNYVLCAKTTYLKGWNVPVVFPFFTSFSFDLTLTSLFLPLVTGGEIRVFAQHDPLLSIHTIINDTTINAIKLTPSHLKLFAEAGVQSCGIRTYVLGGEALPTKTAQEIIKQSNSLAEIFNEYGPTEATIGCVVHRFDMEHDREACVPIGRPIANIEVLLLDEEQQPVAYGEVGEIYLSGACLARGYLARPEEDQRFQPHPFRKGVRVYRTGDRACRMPNGNFDYRGRLDGQLKIRGHRIEISEIETAIEASGLCRSCAVAAEETTAGTRLIAFVVWEKVWDKDREEADLRALLSNQLPAYMMPSRIVALDNMPLNINGKIDKSRLPIERQPIPADNTATSSANQLEQELATMVGNLSGEKTATISMDRSLLESGLDSLQMMLLLTQVAKRFLPEASRHILLAEVRHFLREPSVKNLAANLQRLGCVQAEML